MKGTDGKLSLMPMGRCVAILYLSACTLLSLPGRVWAGAIIFSEIMYNPSGADGFRQRDRNTEWIELFNGGMAEEDLSGWALYKVSRSGRRRLLGTIGPGIRIAAGQALVLVPDGLARPQHFRTAWSIPTTVPVWPLIGWSGTSGAGLPNSGATLELVDASGRMVDQLAYRAAGFPASKNGLAIEFVATGIDPAELARANDDPSLWRHTPEPIPAPGVHGGVLFGPADRGSPGVARITPTPEPITLCLWLACALTAPLLVRQRSGRGAQAAPLAP